MKKLQPSDLVNAISELDKNQPYRYISGSNYLQIVEVEKPEGPIRFRRKGERANVQNVSKQMIAMAAAGFAARPNYPIHIDRLYSGGGNVRSVLETLLAYTPNFFSCYPQKTNPYTGSLEGGKPQKHLMWCPDDAHALGVLATKEFEQVIQSFEFDSPFPKIEFGSPIELDELASIEAKTHTQIQVALIQIGNALSFRTYIARNDQSIRVGETSINELPGVIRSLDEVPLLYKPESRRNAALIDCIWFTQDLDFIPAVVEVEHSTGVTSGLTRMLKFKETLPALNLTFTIVAPDELRSKVVSEANQPLFRNMNTRFMPYTTVRFLYGLVQKYSLTGVVQREFIEPFMERVTNQ